MTTISIHASRDIAWTAALTATAISENIDWNHRVFENGPDGRIGFFAQVAELAWVSAAIQHAVEPYLAQDGFPGVWAYEVDAPLGKRFMDLHRSQAFTSQVAKADIAGLVTDFFKEVTPANKALADALPEILKQWCETNPDATAAQTARRANRP